VDGYTFIWNNFELPFGKTALWGNEVDGDYITFHIDTKIDRLTDG
jgi:hypothetical protein